MFVRSIKTKRSNAECNRNGISNGAAVEQLPDIFKLDIDCFNETMDYLPTKYLATVGQTCKRLRKKAGYIFNQNYPSAIVNVRSDEAKYFPQYIQSIEIKSRRDFNRFVWNQKKTTFVGWLENKRGKRGKNQERT